MLTINAKEQPIPIIHKYLLGAVGPRPICFASTIDKNGNRNLAPFSFFNVFSANPPIAIFSPARSGRTSETKHTHENVKEVPEVVINVVDYSMLHQVTLAGCPFPKGTDEFSKAGFTPIKSELVRPYRVKESPVQMECEVLEVKELGTGGAAGNLIICEVKLIHIRENILDDNKMIDQSKIDLIARMGGNWYCRAHGDAIFELERHVVTCGIGIDVLPEKIKNSKKLTGNHLGQLGNLEVMPNENDINEAAIKYKNVSDKESLAIELLENGETKEAMSLLMTQ
ncbi:MAG: flavin reductase family protein [Bacteroidetes bacterium]|nr:flavin reductase family protein [Bacteroidota bacterium]